MNSPYNDAINTQITEIIMANENKNIRAMLIIFIDTSGNIKVLEAYDDPTAAAMNVGIDIIKRKLMDRVMNNSTNEAPTQRN